MKKSFTLTCLILASVIGAGFASGKEIQVFFTKYGVISFVTIVVAYFLFSWAFKKFLLYGNLTKPKTFFDATSNLFGKFSKVINTFILVCYFIILAGMFAGVHEVYLNVFNSTLAKILVVVTVILAAVENSGGIKAINTINNIFVPITMIVLIISAFLTFKTTNQFSSAANLTTFGGGILAVFTYVGINILLSGSMLISVGKKYSKTNINVASNFSAIILVLIMFLFNLVLINNNINTSMPMLSLSFEINWWWGIITLVCIWFSIYSSITSVTFVLSNSMFKSGNCFSGNLIVCVIAYIVSLFGFNNIVEFLYPIIGVVGIVFTIVLAFKLKTVLKQKRSTMQT